MKELAPAGSFFCEKSRNQTKKTLSISVGEDSITSPTPIILKEDPHMFKSALAEGIGEILGAIAGFFLEHILGAILEGC